MRSSRAFLIWATLALCGAMVVGAMIWLTRGVLASEKSRAEAEARADLEECTRLALWRLDAAGATVVSNENRHPPADYQTGSQAFTSSRDPLAKLHFELRENGKLTSPESNGDRDRLRRLGSLLSNTPLPGDEWSILKRAADASQMAWEVIPKEDAFLEKSNVQQMRKDNGRNSNRADLDYQAQINKAEKAQRTKTVQDALINSGDSAIWGQAMIESQNGLLPQNSQGQDPGASPLATAIILPVATVPQVAELGPMSAIWIGEELFLLRQFTSNQSGIVEKGVQGVWLDHALLKQRLLTEVADLLPQANLVKAAGVTGDPLELVSFPFRLVRNEIVTAGSSPLPAPLVIGWVAVGAALLTASLLVHGVMKLSERRASFVSAVTHELRTPLTTFRLYSEMLESGAVKQEKRGDYLRVLSREADRLSHLVENVLSFSKIERGSARSEVREVTASGLLEPMRERLESRLATAGLTLVMEDRSDIRVRVDTAAVEHILFNLIDNAAKYAAGGNPPQVRIGLKPVGNFVEILVCDNGPGIPRAERARIFRAFHKSAREAAESRPGVGLGLALSRRLAKSLGGGLDCVDNGPGACFVLRLPRA